MTQRSNALFSRMVVLSEIPNLPTNCTFVLFATSQIHRQVPVFELKSAETFTCFQSLHLNSQHNLPEILRMSVLNKLLGKNQWSLLF